MCQFHTEGVLIQNVFASRGSAIHNTGSLSLSVDCHVHAGCTEACKLVCSWIMLLLSCRQVFSKLAIDEAADLTLLHNNGA